MKHYITKALLCLSMALLVFNCQKEEITEDHSIENKAKSGIKIVKLTSKDITQNKGITEKLDFFTETLKTRQQNKTIYSSEHDFYINTEFATYIEKANGSHSYTFPVQYANETGEINNLVLHSQEDGSYKAIYVSYDVTEDEKALINQGVIVNLEGKVSIAIINDNAFIDTLFSKVTTSNQCLEPDYSVGPCNAGYTYEHKPEPFSGYSGGMCSGSVYTLVNVGYDMDCVNAIDWGSPGSGTANTGTGNPSGTPNGGGLNTGNTDPLTTPVTCEGCPEVEEEEEDCPDITPSAELVSMMNTVFGEGNYEIGCPDPSGEMGFTTIEELIVLRDSLFGTVLEPDEVIEEPTGDQNEVIIRYVFHSGVIQYTVRVKQEIGTDYVNFSDYAVLNVTASANKFMIDSVVHSYEIESFSLQDYAVSRDSYVSKVVAITNTVTKATIAGNSTTLGGDQKFTLKMNATDGSKISGTMNED